MKILHVASFSGNIGDNANHSGLRFLLDEYIGSISEYTELEIRKCYQIYSGANRWQFDDTFVRLANNHDLVIIGGGNYFEPWLDASSTGTTIDLAPEVLEKICKPLVFFGVGFDIHKGASAENLEKFRLFMEATLAREKTLVTFRNDGSIKNFREALPFLDSNCIYRVPDGGFFIQCNVQQYPFINLDSRYWGINIASDMKERRFPSGLQGSLGWNEFIVDYTKLLSKALDADPNLKLLFFPHIFKDLEAISELLAALDDSYCRDRLIVAPFLNGWQGADYIFGLYRHCELVMGMRFHANVCAIGMNVPVIPLASYPKLYDLYEELEIQDRVVWVNQQGFTGKLEKQIHDYNAQREILKADNLVLVQRLREDVDSFFPRLEALL
ncbi:polysaccharide pyruvyl transferase family protein [Motiliproteus sp. MSK22-1]|uniref:polysaccharide pyruvyl transferase family protein n=1 Tax=Motiliproteus sp. MSK22-1 TaxID=1897630 RepID=UPI000975D5BA|nr:polysaccharide pyruvyl transferase family protein [Motiliproteus sp. MSK22-1]OMH30019.1 hypothetical protein BGP75_19000 [Motiliproteus sp. MSK22-1]